MILSRWRLLLPIVLLPACVLAQNAPTTTSLTTSSPALQLPGSINLTSVVAPPNGGGVPYDHVSFFYDSTNLLGTAPLTIVPSTETFNTAVNTTPTTTPFGTSPFGLFPLKFPGPAPIYSVLGVLDYYAVPQSAGFFSYYPELTVFSGKGTGLFGTSASYPILTSNFTNYSTSTIDAYAIGDFNGDGYPDLMIHGTANNPTGPGPDYSMYPNSFYVLFGKADGTFDTTSALSGEDESGATCACSNPTELVAIDDFNGDGLSDVVYVQDGKDPAPGAKRLGVIMNPGPNGVQGHFGQFLPPAPAVPGSGPGSSFLATGIATGHFTLSGFPDVALLGQFVVPGQTLSATAQGCVQIYLNANGDGNIVPHGTCVPVGVNPVAIATGTFGQNRLADVAVANQGDGTVQVLANDGTGGLLTPGAADTITVGGSPSALTVADFNSDGFPDILVTDGVDGSQRLLLNDGTGHFAAPVVIGTAPGRANLATAGDFNGDALPDVATITPPVPSESFTPPPATINLYVNSASSQAGTFTTAPQTLPAGTHTLTATYGGDLNFTASTSAGVPVTVTQTTSTLLWAAPAAIEYGTPLSGTQLNATASVAGLIVYNPPTGTLLTPGSHTLAATFVPTDTFDYTGATAAQTISVTAPAFTGIAPASAAIGSPAVTIIVTGQGLLNGAQVLWNGTPLATTFVNLNQITAVVPANFLASGGTFTITVTDPNGVAVAGSQIFSVTTQQQKSNSTISLTTSSPTLVRPGSVTLTAVVNQPPVAGGVPVGNVSFTYDGTNALGTAPLTILPATETLPGSPSGAPATSGTNPVGVAAVQRTAGGPAVLVSADSLNGNVELYDLTSSFATPTQYLYNLSGSSTFPQNDSIGSGYFLMPKSSGIQSFLVHTRGAGGYGSGRYAVFDGSVTTTRGISALTAPKISTSGCNCSNPDQEVIAIDDFNGDGYSDVGSLIAGTYYSPTTAGVTLNTGQSNSGNFASFLPAPLPTNFCALAITTGHFTPAAGAELAVLGATPASNSCGSITPTDTTSVHLFGLNSSNALADVGSTATDPGATTLTAADLNKDGNSDLIVGEPAGLKIALGNGDGTFQAASSLYPTTGAPVTLSVNDLNGDGYLDVAASLAGNGGLAVLLNDGTGKLKPATQPYALAATPVGIATADLNLDGLPDLAVVVPGNQQATVNGSINILLNSASSQATFVVGPQALPLGTHALTASFAGDANFGAVTSTAVQETVSETSTLLTWAQPAAIEYGVPLGAAQLNAIPPAGIPGTISYNPGSGTVLTPGAHTLTAVFTPTDTADYTSSTASVTLIVSAPTLTSATPLTAKLGDPDTTITVNGQGLVNGAVVSWNSTALKTTFVNLNQLTAVVPTSLFNTAGSYTITVADPNNIAVAGSQVFTVTASTPTVTATASATLTSGEQGSLNLSVSPYPAPLTATLTISFTPTPPNTVTDPAVLFTNNSTTEIISIPANSTTPIPPIPIAAGSTAGTITITIVLNAGGVNVTPTGLAPVVIVVPATPPTITSATISRSGKSFQVIAHGLSSTRDMVQAEFVFTPAAGKSISITHIIVPLATAFGTWYGSTDSQTLYGTTFTYTQPFTLNSPATDIESVTVTLTNSKGSSQPASVH